MPGVSFEPGGRSSPRRRRSRSTRRGRGGIGSRGSCFSRSGSKIGQRPRAAHSPMAKRSKNTTSGGTPPAIAHISRCASPVRSRAAALLMITRYSGFFCSKRWMTAKISSPSWLAAPEDDLRASVFSAIARLRYRPDAQRDEQRDGQARRHPQRNLATMPDWETMRKVHLACDSTPRN